jgi:hypothetical protein
MNVPSSTATSPVLPGNKGPRVAKRCCQDECSSGNRAPHGTVVNKEEMRVRMIAIMVTGVRFLFKSFFLPELNGVRNGLIHE